MKYFRRAITATYLENVQKAQDVSTGTSDSTVQNRSHWLPQADVPFLHFFNSTSDCQARSPPAATPPGSRGSSRVPLRHLSLIFSPPFFTTALPQSIILSRLHCYLLLIISGYVCSFLTSPPSTSSSSRGFQKRRWLMLWKSVTFL